jgi:simple sugar transport system ATP-binding protein
MTPILELRNGTKDYRGVAAVKDVSFTLHRGEVHALLGENGAGKSTLTKMLAGVVEPTSGEVWVNGRKAELKSPSEALKLGIAMVYQETSLVPSLTVAQNLYLTDAKRFHRLRGIYIAGRADDLPDIGENEIRALEQQRRILRLGQRVRGAIA